ncbi:MAG TPA: DnaJ domain-containing protein [Solirubrobacteraceae bacterium]
MDPYAVLGLAPGAPEREVTAAYRELAKRWHPDRGAGTEREQRMAEINAAYDLLRSAAEIERRRPRPASASAGGRRRGGWLPDAVRRALGAELLEALADGEAVRLVTPVATWASPRAILAVTERRLLWLLDDAPVARVRTLSFRDVAHVEHHLRRPRRRVATLTLRTIAGRRLAFTGLRPQTAATIERHVRGEAPGLRLP